MVDLLERLDVMSNQESTSYKTIDYLKPEYQSKLASICDPSHLDGILTTTGSSLASSSSGINDIWREKICEWSYQVIDHFDFSREIVSISIHYLDRFLATRPCNKKVFQLAAMTTLFLAIKLYEPGKLSMYSMIELSRGYFKVEQMLAMEVSILRYVGFSGPTDSSFLRALPHGPSAVVLLEWILESNCHIFRIVRAGSRFSWEMTNGKGYFILFGCVGSCRCLTLYCLS